MQKKRTGRMLCSLALSAVTLWGVSVTAPAKDARDALRSLKDETLGVMLLRYERGDGGEDFLSLRTSLALHATPLLREGEENIAQAWSAELEQKPDDSADETGDAQDNEGTVLTQEETPDEIAVTENGSPARTLKASDPSGYTVFGNVYINNGSDAALDASMLAGDYAAKLGAQGPQVLIIHTHGSESYTMPPGQEYDVSDTFRTLDTNCNMIRIGDEMAQVLTDAGISVVHDRSLYDYPSYSGAYNRSLASIESYLQKYPSISFVLDVHRDAVQDAIANAKRNGVRNATFVCEDAGRFMTRMAQEREGVDVVFLDPPRSGSDEAFLRSLCALGPKRVVYISCNPQTQKRDLAVLAAGGYRVEAVQPVDMFPQTGHCECIASLSK